MKEQTSLKIILLQNLLVTQWAGGTAVQGIHNLAGTLAVTVAG